MPKMPDKSKLAEERRELAEERRKRDEEKNKNKLPYKRRQGFSKGTPNPNTKGGIATGCGKVMSNKRKVTKVF